MPASKYIRFGTWEVCVRISIFVALFLVVAAFPARASSKKWTDAELDGFKGAVKSVSTNVQVLESHPDSIDHPVIAHPVWCPVCEYDEAGNSIKQGQNFDGRFVGETSQYVRNEDGTIREKISVTEKGQVSQKIALGPFGMTEREYYLNGVLQDRQTFRYDQSGNLIEWLTFDADGNQTASSTASFDEQGNVTEQFDRGPGQNFLHFTQSFDPDTGVQTFTNFNKESTVRLTFTAKDNRITNYWEQPGAKREYGSGVCFNSAPKERECEDHYPDRKVWHQSERFIDEHWHDPIHVELRDETGELQMAADYEYEFDSHGNWTKRSVWMWRAYLGERKLHEVDSRTLSYWK
jgi:hypothetical protein